MRPETQVEANRIQELIQKLKKAHKTNDLWTKLQSYNKLTLNGENASEGIECQSLIIEGGDSSEMRLIFNTLSKPRELWVVKGIYSSWDVGEWDKEIFPVEAQVKAITVFNPIYDAQSQTEESKEEARRIYQLVEKLEEQYDEEFIWNKLIARDLPFLQLEGSEEGLIHHSDDMVQSDGAEIDLYFRTLDNPEQIWNTKGVFSEWGSSEWGIRIYPTKTEIRMVTHYVERD